LLGPPLAPLPQLQVCPVLRAPELDAGLLGGSHQSGAEGQNPFPRPTAHAAGDVKWNVIESNIYVAGHEGCPLEHSFGDNF